MLEIKDLAFSYTDATIFSDLSYQIHAGDRHTIVGPSGVGKSTFLKLIMGTLTPQSGDIKIAGKSVIHPFKAPHQRPVTLISQEDTLFPHLTVAQNIMFGAPKKTPDLLKIWLEALELTPLASRYPSELSGGEAQRVMLGRALIYAPAIILMDEPFKALDESLKLTLIDRFKTLFKDVNQTVLTVTHDASVAHALEGHIYRLDGGHLERR